MKHGLRFGWIFGAALIGYGLFYRLANIHYTSPLGWVFYLMLPVAVHLALRASRNEPGSDLTFIGAIGVGSLTTALSSALYCVYVYIHNRFFDDSLLRVLLYDQQLALANQGLSDADQAHRLEWVRTLTQPFAFSVVVFIQLFLFGLMATVILATAYRLSNGKKGFSSESL